MSAQLQSLLEQEFRPRILLVGDVMLDRYLWGEVERISPEAPIPILRVARQEHRLGGAGNVASMLSALRTSTALFSVTGDDPEALAVRELLRGLDVDCGGLLTDPGRATTVKERLLGRTHQRHPHHMMRVDREDDRPIDAALREQLLARIEQNLEGIDLILISDYNKGVCAGDMISRLIEIARRAAVRVLADPIKGADYHRYAGCTCITPNRTEAGLATGRKILTPQDGLDAAKRLLEFGVETALVTLDRDGMAWADQAGNARLFSCRPRQVCDITGAGDMVLSALACCLAAGADFPAAIEIANVAGGLEVEQLGVVPLSREEILAELSQVAPTAERKVLEIDALQTTLQRQRLLGRRIVMTNGCFDLLHPGHINSLQEARKQGDLLVVGLNSDRSVRALKGPTRPLIDQQGRADMLAALACVDYVVVFDDASVAGLVEQIRPDVLCKGSEYAAEGILGREFVTSYGGSIVTVPMKPGYSTSGLIETIRNLPDRKRSAA